VNGTSKCSFDLCPDPAVTRFAQRELCLEHFISRCYEDLDRFDARARGSQLDRSGSATLKAFVDECSRCALEVSLELQQLDNLQRARLLDILLWAGELWPKAGAGRPSARPRRSVGSEVVGSGAALIKNAAR